ncbi:MULTISPECIES: hypothetical protein [unclassified Knoellia]|uniref:hypothetical protein n=1 Tax=Knoellia altitudinis TaxID=3404795 RepID=UPI0036236292
MRQLAGLPGLLAQVDLKDIEDVSSPAVPQSLLPTLVAGVRRGQRRRSVLIGALAAAVGAIVAGSVVVAVGLPGSGEPEARATPPAATASRTPSVPMEAVGATSLRADLVLAEVAWGTRVDMTCSYGRVEDDYPTSDAPSYSLVVLTYDGRTEEVATWKGLPGRTMRVSGATATERRDIERVELRNANGMVLLELTV